jgi:hypothetical protein
MRAFHDTYGAPRHAGLVLVAAIAAVVFWCTAYPTITWWDSSQYSLAAATLGLTGAPGSLLLTLLGWLVTRIPLASPAHVLNLVAGALAAVSAGLVCLAAVRLSRTTDLIVARTPLERLALVAGVALGALTFAFSETLWEHAIKFTPYILTALFTALILWTMLRWWDDADEPDAWRRLAWLGLLIGLDFSVHRTNALLLPALFAWILVRRPGTLKEPRAWLGGAAGLVAGLAVQLLVIPIATLTRSPLLIGEPTNWSGFWDYVSLQMRGGGFLVQFFPRHAPFWSVQVHDFLRVMGADFFRWNGALGPIGALPALVGIVGMAQLWHRDRRLGTAFALVLVLQAAMTVLYFNIPARFFRPLDRHYLPVCVTIGVLVAFGAGALLRDAAALAARRRPLVAILGAILLLAMPAASLLENWGAHDASRRYFALDFATNALIGLPPDAIVFTAGDNDTFPLWYVQAVEGVRPDVQLVNLSLANLPSYIDRLARRDSSFPLSLDRAARRALAPREWKDTTMALPVVGTAEQLGLPPGTGMPDSITLQVTPAQGNVMYVADLVLLDLVKTNRWRRPLCFSTTVGPAGMRWLQPYGRRDGLFWRIEPVVDSLGDLARLRTNLRATYTYRGYADLRVRLDDVSRIMGLHYFTAFLALAERQRERGDLAGCRVTAVSLLAALPPARVTPDAAVPESPDQICAPPP